MKVETTETVTIGCYEPVFGSWIGYRRLQIHSRNLCSGDNCCFHNPSDHPLRCAEMRWRDDSRVIERMCGHGVGHTDPDSIAHNKTVNPNFKDFHGCDGCCKSIDWMNDK